jgi:hypothetical protein
MQYQMLVVDLEEDTIPVDALQKIADLVAAGATIILGERKPVRATGLHDYPDSDEKVRQLAEQLWHDRSFARGNIFSGTSMEGVLKHKNRLPDFEAPFEYIHRRTADSDIYFVSGRGKAECTFRVQGKEPEFWDPVSGAVRDAVSYNLTADGRISVPIDLYPNGSIFVVFRKPAQGKYINSTAGPAEGLEIVERNGSELNLRFWKSGAYRLATASGRVVEAAAEIPPAVTLSGAWQVSFTADQGTPQKAVFDQLQLWNEHKNDGIRYYSGSATYSKAFTLTAEQARGPARLQLGEVHDIARIYLNGKDLGVVWTAPWSADLGDALKAGDNELLIEVTNCWANRLIGDAGLPAQQRYTETNVRLIPDRGPFLDYEAYSAKDELMPSGLLGPVRIEFCTEQKMTL